ncbi:CwfJ domain protein [Talaromyces stipitatus ATCC 10500]|uniref:CwfJ domain protein n=1 Tax=Talaromyces stipitatus (strain ATCC 10500 / CBS 375.48 / QM 6759 / NRRL 1006) TaxID=441959 RepID=B8LZJ0_TALSN|nr:CwfJ domain protein [Talaromyces stipitatus ATCC 10500]EED22072.1 CwfJ domain protein [Talaromyces stipitatus ATCC 10500]
MIDIHFEFLTANKLKIMASKILVLGTVNCAFQQVFTKLAKLQAKQNFAFAIVVGDLFGEGTSEEELNQISALLAGNIVVPLPTYFSVGKNPIPTRVVEKIQADDEVCPNLYFLGRRGTLKTSEGIRIAALGGEVLTDGQSDPNVNKRYHSRYTESDARSLYGVHDTDILITYEWPKGVTGRSNVPLTDKVAPEGVQCVADVCSTLKPRYHFSSKADFFYEREPFFHIPTEENPDTKFVTRFINIASYGNPSGQKWMYAFTYDPKAPIPETIPTGTTVSPLANVARKRPALESQNQGFQRFSRGNNERPQKRARRPPPGPGECFFCLSNPNIATHIIASIGNDAYLTTAKGPLTKSDMYPLLGFPGHMLIIPLIHSPTFSSIADPEARRSTYDEMQRYRVALNDMVREKSKSSLGSVTWEVSRGNGIHVHWQYLPVASDLISKGLVEAAFKVEAENLQYPKFKSSANDDGANEVGDYFRVWISQPATDGDSKDQTESSKSGSDKILILALTPDFRFDLQFGRRVMAKLLQLEKRMDWRECEQTTEEEVTDVEAFKDAFKKHDFSLEEE